MGPLGARYLPVPIVLALLVTLLIAPPAAASTTSTSGASTSTSLVNQERAARGIAQLQVSSELNRIATDWSHQMAKEGRLYHNPNLASQTGPATWRAENVGTHPGPIGVDTAVRRVHDMFMSSSGHRANILETRVHEIGVGVVQADDGSVWITQVFRSRSTSGGTQTEPTEPEPTEPKRTEPKPESSEPKPAEKAPSEPAPASEPADPAPPPSAAEPAPDTVEEVAAPDPAPTHRAMTAPRLSLGQLEELKSVRSASADVHPAGGPTEVLAAGGALPRIPFERPWTVGLNLLLLATAGTLTAGASGLVTPSRRRRSEPLGR